MVVYIGLLIFILLNGIVAKKNRKYYIVSTFLVFIIIASLRKYSIGIDLEIHYADSYMQIANLNWNELSRLTTIGGYDIGYVVFCKLLSYISGDVQFYIAMTSIIIFGSVGRFIYRYSDNVVLETFIFMAGFLFFMYMNIIAQALAVAVILFSLDQLFAKKYIRYILLVFLAATIHSSALVCLLFIPISFIPAKKKYIVVYTGATIAIALAINSILPFLIKNFFPQYAFYFLGNNTHAQGYGFSPFTAGLMLISAIGLIISFLVIDSKNLVNQSIPRLQTSRSRKCIEIMQPNLIFLIFMAIAAVVIRILSTQIELVGRAGYYVYFLSFNLIPRSIECIKNLKKRKIITGLVYILLLAFFASFATIAGKQSYGVVPYEFFWE